MIRRPLLQAAALAALLALSTGCYLTHVAFGQLDVSLSTVEVEKALADPAIDEAAKAKIRFVGEIKRFAQDRVGMKPSDNYTTYYPGDADAPLTWVVTASERLKLEAVTHWYPIIGSVSYKGFFDKEWAEEEAADLRAEGYDVLVRPVAAYSTLGWFTDPITPSMLKQSEPELAELILHELTHGEIYAAGQTDFNESLASFVGHQAALQMAAERWGADAPEVRLLHDAAADERLFDTFMRDLKGKLTALYGDRELSEAQKLERREVVFREAAEELKEKRDLFRVHAYDGFARQPINNAVIMGYLSYHDTDLFEALWKKVGGSWAAFFDAAEAAAGSKDPFRALQQAVQED